MFVVEPNDNLSYDDNQWNGEVNEIAKITKTHMRALQTEVTKRTDQLQSTLNDFARRDNIQDRYLKNLVQKKMKKLNLRVQEMNNNVENKFELLKNMIQDLSAQQMNPTQE